MSDRVEDARRSLLALVRLIGLGVLVAAVVRELRTPTEERTWHGTLGVVPYDLRPPTPTRVREAWWNPDDERLLTPRAFGAGWALNLGRLWALVRR